MKKRYKHSAISRFRAIITLGILKMCDSEYVSNYKFIFVIIKQELDARRLGPQSSRVSSVRREVKS